MKGIKARITVSYIVIILITVVILELFLITAVKTYYYDSAENALINQIKTSAEFYTNYLSSSTVQENVQNNSEIFLKNTNSEVQIYDLSGSLLMDSIGYYSEHKGLDRDVKHALSGELSTLISKDESSGEKIISVSYPLKHHNETQGVLRFVASLKNVDKVILKIAFLFLGVGLIVISISSVLSIFISKTIVTPITEIITYAKKLASGRFTERIAKSQDDEIGELVDTMNFMAEEIHKSEKLKNEFIASVSHELRTPLTAIKGWADTIASGDMNDKDEIKIGIDIISSESDRLTLLVEELLDFSKFVSGRVTLNKDYISLSNVIEHIKNQLMPRAVRQNISFNVSYDSNMPIIVADENRLKQVFINLLDNAFKFTTPGGSVSLNSSVKDNNRISIIITDTGEGIPEEELPLIKQKFFKGKSANSKNGIGLSICDEIIKLHGGDFNIYSKFGKGTQVEVLLPYDREINMLQ